MNNSVTVASSYVSYFYIMYNEINFECYFTEIMMNAVNKQWKYTEKNTISDISMKDGNDLIITEKLVIK